MSQEKNVELDAVDVYRTEDDKRTPEQRAGAIVEQIRHNMGLDVPLHDPAIDQHFERSRERTASMLSGLTPGDHVERPVLTMPTFEETLARHDDPYERAKAEQQQREAVAPNMPARPQVEYRTDDQPPEWSRTLAESKASPNKVEYLLEQAGRQGNPDAGAMARDALMAFQNLCEDNRRKRIKFWLGWFVFFLLLAAIAGGIWKILPEYVVSGRYTVTAECKADFGKGEITGTRTFSYQYKSLFGYHLVDESSAIERTVINVTGDKMIVLGLDNETKKTWRQNIGLGERGIAILKHADLYWFVGDKDMATVPYTTFCH